MENTFIEARDGVRLHARLWMPTDLEGPAPAILTLTPYTSDDGHRFGTFYASHGYVYVHADVRGRGESEGESWPLERDGLDGADIVSWITGHFDGDQPGAMKYYRDHMTHGSDANRSQHYLIMGPWDHGGTRIPQAELGGLTFGANSVLDMEAVHLAWFDWILREGPKPGFLEDRVAYCVMEANKWRFAFSLDSASQTEREWYLTSDGPVADVFHSGRLSVEVPDLTRVDEFVHDPLKIVAESEGDAAIEGFYLGGGLAFDPGPKAVYHSDPLDAPLVVSGYATLELFVELDVPDIDLLAGLYEIRADGSTVFLGMSELRARHRNGVDKSELVTPGTVERFAFDRFYWFSRELKKGSRIRIVVAPLNSPDRDKNYQNGGNTIQESGADARTATVRIHHGPTYPSRLVLPVAGRGN